MIHLYSSEAASAASLVLFVFIFTFLWYFRIFWPGKTTPVDILVLILSCAYGCRLTAKGKVCKWPANVDFTGRVALVVGASSGVGYSTAAQLAEHGWTVIITARNTERLLYVKKSMERRVQACGSKGVVKVLGTVDLRSDVSIRAYVASLAAVKAKMPVGLLVMAAGALHRRLTFVGASSELASGDASVANSPAAWRTLESTMASNAVGPFLFTQLMLPLLDETAEKSSVTSRIVNVGSSCHSFLGLGWRAGKDPLAMLQGLDHRGAQVVPAGSPTPEGTARAAEKGPYEIKDFGLLNFVGYYGLSKLCVMWNTRLLAQQVATRRFTAKPRGAEMTMRPVEGSEERQNQLKIFVACTHPGIVTTYLYRELLPPRVLDFLLYYPSLVLGKTWFEAAQSTLKAAVEDTDMVQGGYYLCSGEYGPESGVNCVSAHAQNPTELQAYREWLMSKVTPCMESPESTKA